MKFYYREAFVTVAAINFKEIVTFYTQMLSIQPNPYLSDVYAEFSLPGLRLGIFKPKSSNESEFYPNAKSSISLCLEVDDLDGAIAHLSALGFPSSGEISTASHGREIYAYDPAGNRLILHESRG